MPENTPNLDLYLKNPVTDGTDTFNIETMLNENFRKLDEKTARVGLDGKLDPTQRAAPAIVTVDGDLDTYKTPGSYYVPTGIPNTPFTTNSYYMQVYAEGLLVMQVLYGRVNPNLMFMRRFNGTWGEWDNYSKGIANGIALQDDVTTHLADLVSHMTQAEKDKLNATDNAKFKKSNSTYTDNDTSQTFTDAFCTVNSLVTVTITSATPPQGVWTVNSATGSFTITSTVAESTDITFDYYIQKAVG